MGAYIIYTDGREELVRGVDLIGTPLTAFSQIAAADDQPDVFNGICGAESGGVPVSAHPPLRQVKKEGTPNELDAGEGFGLVVGLGWPRRAGGAQFAPQGDGDTYEDDAAADELGGHGHLA